MPNPARPNTTSAQEQDTGSSANTANTNKQQVQATPMNAFDKKLLDCYTTDFTQQVNRLDDLAKQLVTLSIALPGLLVVVLEMDGSTPVSTQEASHWVIWSALLAWCLAMGFALLALLPQKHQVNRTNPKEVQSYFSASARRKYNLLRWACLANFIAICLSLLNAFYK